MLSKFIDALKNGLEKTRNNVFGKIAGVVQRKYGIDDEMLDEIEEILIGADMGVETSLKVIETVKEKVKERKLGNSPEMISPLLRETIVDILDRSNNKDNEVKPEAMKPFVVLVVGVNGVGKTTTIGKLSEQYRNQGKKVMVAACDTFRAAAIEQLEVWAKRTKADLVKHQMGADAASVAFDALNAAVARDVDVLIIDTAGRLHTKINLMEELKKIKRTLERKMEGAPHETLLVLDATTGQNAIAQVSQFDKDIQLTGMILAKLDGTAKGGIVVAVADKFNIPLKMIGIGEKLDDLRDFDREEFAEALFG